MKTTSCILVAYFLSFTLLTYAKTKAKGPEKKSANIEQMVKDNLQATYALSMLKDMAEAASNLKQEKAEKSEVQQDKSKFIGDPFAYSNEAFNEEDPWPQYNL